MHTDATCVLRAQIMDVVQGPECLRYAAAGDGWCEKVLIFTQLFADNRFFL